MKALNSDNLAAIDPVCGMQIDSEAKQALIVSRRGHTYYFCTEQCRNAFERDPAKYTDILNITRNRKGWWGRYLDRVQKATKGKPPTCCQ